MKKQPTFINPQREQNARLMDAAHAESKASGKLGKEFSKTLGTRTLSIIGKIGLADKSSFNGGGLSTQLASTVRTSRTLEFRMPGDDRDYGLRFGMTHHPWWLKLPGRTPPTMAVEAEITRREADDRLKRDWTELSSHEYINSIPLNDPAGELHRGSVPEYARRRELFVKILNFAEAVVAGNWPEAETVNPLNHRPTALEQSLPTPREIEPS